MVLAGLPAQALCAPFPPHPIRVLLSHVKQGKIEQNNVLYRSEIRQPFNQVVEKVQ